jgi:hypothetical protein
VSAMRDRRTDFVKQFLAETGTPDEFEPLERTPPSASNHDGLRSMIETLADEVGEAVGQQDRELSALRDELNELRAALEVERKLKIVDLPDWRRKRGDAA